MLIEETHPFRQGLKLYEIEHANQLGFLDKCSETNIILLVNDQRNLQLNADVFFWLIIMIMSVISNILRSKCDPVCRFSDKAFIRDVGGTGWREESLCGVQVILKKTHKLKLSLYIIV